MQAHDTDILQQHPIHRHLLDLARREADNEQAAIPGNALHRRRDQADGIKHYIHAAALGRQPLDPLRPGRIPIVDGVVGAKRPRDLQLVRRPGRRDDGGAEGLGHLHGRQPDAARGRVHQHVVAGPDARPRHEGGVARRRRHEQAGRVEEAPSRGHGPQPVFARGDEGGVAALAGAEDFVADGEFGRGGGGGWGAEDDAGEFGAGDPGQRRLVLVFAPDLEQVEEVGCGGVDGDEVFVRRGGGVWDGGYGQVFGALGVVGVSIGFGLVNGGSVGGVGEVR